jgi:RNA polymerase sigma factor (sigma-70 family)
MGFWKEGNSVNLDFDIQKLREGDGVHWSQVFPVLFGVAFKIASRHPLLGLNTSTSEDVAQEAVVQVVNKFGFEPEQGFNDLIRFTRTVALRRGIDWIRKENSEKRGSGKVSSLHASRGENGSVLLDKIADFVDGQDDLNMRETLRMLEECLERSLRGSERQVFAMHFVQGWKHSEVSRMLDMPMGTVGPQLKRSREKVRSCMKEKGYGT